MRILIAFLSFFIMSNHNDASFAESFYLDSKHNVDTLRFELDNDCVWNKDNNFTNGWSLQYHTVRYSNWDDATVPEFVKWVGNHFPTLDNADSIVRISQGIGQNMITPGDIKNATPQKGDLPYAGTLTYSLSWQSFNRTTARNFQVSIGLLGEPSLSEHFQKFVHNNLGRGDDPKGWDTQRDIEPIINVGYQYSLRLAHLGDYNNGFAGQLSMEPSASLGNLFTAAELSLVCRFGWNILEGFNAYPSPPGRGFYQASYLPKPSSASPHGIEIITGIRGSGLAYTVIYDGSFLTGDDRNVKRNNFFYTAGVGIFYHYYDVISIRATIERSSNVLEKNFIPPPSPGRERTAADASFGSIIVDFHF